MKSKIPFILIIVFLFPFIVVGCNHSPSTSTTNIIELESQEIPLNSSPTSEFLPRIPTPDPKVYEECRNKGGRWDILGFSGPGCNLPTTDAGQVCRDSEECEGVCFTDQEGIMKETEAGLFPDSEAIQVLNAQEEEIVGFCSEWKFNYGLLILVENGEVQVVSVD
jgi:hypothetical protein